VPFDEPGGCLTVASSAVASTDTLDLTGAAGKISGARAEGLMPFAATDVVGAAGALL